MIRRIKGFIKAIIWILRINWVKTLYLNFRTQSFFIALKLPIIVFGKLKIKSLRGEIKLEEDYVRFGMFQLGRDIDSFPQTYLPNILNIIGVLEVKGNVIVSGGVNITCWKGSTIKISDKVRIGSGSVIKAQSLIQIGKMTRITSNCVVMDSDVHFLRDENFIVKRGFGGIVIGEFCWINAGSVISKKSVLPDYTIVVRNSYVNKDFSDNVSKGILIGGAPAIVIKENVCRIFSETEEQRIKDYFLTNTEVDFYDASCDVFDDYKESIAFFKIF